MLTKKELEEIKDYFSTFPKLYAVDPNVCKSSYTRLGWGSVGLEDNGWTISYDKTIHGWETDGGSKGYALPKEVALHIEKMSDVIQRLIEEINEQPIERDV